MCGRFVVSYTLKELMGFLANTFSIFDLDIDLDVPRYNIAPGQQVISVLSDGEVYRAGTLRWGLVPPWSNEDKIGYKMINARSETLQEKASFKESFRTKRCLILADGFYEWKRDGNQKQPMLIQTKDKEMFLFAGLWSVNKRVSDTPLYTTTIITTKANEMMSDIHDRMPVILSLEDAKKWVDPTISDSSLLQSLLTQYDSNEMSYYEVSSIVNNAKNDVPECMVPISQEEGLFV